MSEARQSANARREEGAKGPRRPPTEPTEKQIAAVQIENRQTVDRRPVKCTYCGADIYFLRTIAGEKMPVDAQRRSVLTSDGRLAVGYQPHFPNCAGRG